MLIKSEQELLDQQTRKAIIEEIKGSENQARKYEAYKRYLIYKDQTDAFVREQLLKQFDTATVEEMNYCIANVSIVRKIIDKLARVYNSGVRRELIGDENGTAAIEDLSKVLEINSELKKTNRFLKLQKNLAFYIKPCPIEINGGNPQYTIRLEPLNPYLYDAVEYEYDRRRAMAYVLSDFDFNQPQYTINDAATVGRTASPTLVNDLPQGDGKDQIIADSPDDAKSQVFVWWSDNYHFTTDENGKIISESTENPIKVKPFVNFAIDQDGQFWARGGDDLIKGGILVNSVLTHNQHVAVTQGYGQFWMRGKNLPKNIKIGPTKAILMEYEEGEPAPDLGYASANPQIDQLRSLADSYVALLLSTNNLSTSAVASQLGQSNTAPSGIAMMIDKAESREDTQDQQQIFLDAEPRIWEIIRRWMEIYRDALVPELAGLSIPENFEMNIKFIDAPVVMSEAEKLANLKLRKELGLDTMIDILMKDNPDLTKEDAEEKLKMILEEKMAAKPNMGQESKNSESEDESEDMAEESKDEEDGNEIDEGQQE